MTPRARPSATLSDHEAHHKIRELAIGELPHLNAPYGAHLAEDTVFGLELPYSALKGQGFERLCFHLLLSQGRKPRFFGESGNAQFGIDLIVSDGGSCEVYQCKNVAGYGARDLERDLEKFEREWLIGNPDLLRPTCFTLCVSERLTDRNAWENAKREFCQRTNVTVSEWHRDVLDVWLGREPDIVADLFGDAIAERYCERKNWNDGRFRPLTSYCGDPQIVRFLELAKAGKIVVDPKTTESFNDILGLQSMVLIEGRSGAGKTTTALALAEASERRVFFVRMDESIDENTLFEGVKGRCARETTFVIDDCHRGWTKLENACRRWEGALAGRDYRIVLTAQTAAKGSETYDLGVIDLVEDLRSDKATIEINPDESHYRAVLARMRAGWAAASDAQVRHLYEVTAGSLAVLEIVAESGADSLEGAVSIEAMATRVLKPWFHTATPTAPHLRAFAAVAQFDIMIPAGVAWPEPEGSRYRGALQRLIWRYGDHIRGIAPSWRFSHPAAAELIFRALTAVLAEGTWLAAAAKYLVDHFCREVSNEAAFADDLALFLRGRLRFSDDAQLKEMVLGTSEFQLAFERRVDDCPLSIVRLSAFLTRASGQESPYAKWLLARIRMMLAEPEKAAARDFAVFGYALRTINLVDPVRRTEIGEPANVAPMLRLIQ
jgi:hypothetical protein